MRRREFIGLVGGAAICPLAASAQRMGTAVRPRVGVLWGLGENESSADFSILMKAFAELGYAEKKNIEFSNLFPVEQDEYPSLARKLVDQKVDVIVGVNGWAAYWAINTTLDIPVVGIHDNTLNDGYAKSLANPSGNVTGLTQIADELTVKRLSLLKDTVPNLSRVGLLFDPRNGNGRLGDVIPTVMIHKHAAEDLGLSLEPLAASTPRAIEEAIGNLGHDAGAVSISPQPLFIRERARVAASALARKIPTIAIHSQATQAGVLMSYGPDRSEYLRKVAIYVDKILKGAKAADLPIEQPTHLKLAINLKTAGAIGLAIPGSLLVSADEVFE